MRLDALHTFCTLVETGNFHRTADRVNRTQPAVTQQLQGLERDLGHTLIDRKTGAPTPAGRVLYERATGVLRGADNLVQALSDFDESAVGALRVGTSDTNALYYLPPFIKAFAKAMPQTRLVVVSRSSAGIADEVERGNLDLGIVTLPMDRPALDTKPLFEQRLVLVVPRRDPLASKTRVSLRAIHDRPLVLLERDTHTGALLRRHFEERNFDPHVVMDSGSFEVIKRYVAEGIGISIVPEMVITKRNARELATVSIPGLPKVSIGVITRRDAYETKSARAFLDMLSD